MEKLTINEKTLNKYFGVLENLDINSKKNLIIRLTKSINKNPKQLRNLKNIFGAWHGSEDAEDIINEIKDSRHNNRKIEEF